ncbi:MAG: hypothetical protein CBB71_05280 [Rhodopirellula sp. TMED11]|nr:MAG: hypothetical protein CBB71_05280 [Rhodopirellula sp. TMED11]
MRQSLAAEALATVISQFQSCIRRHAGTHSIIGQILTTLGAFVGVLTVNARQPSGTVLANPVQR